MTRLKILDFEDLKRNLNANNVIYKQLSPIEKREFFKKRKILKSKQLEIKNQRIKDIQKEGKPFFIIKIKSDCINQYNMESCISYTEDEIYMAKKCILNKWNYPPTNFFNKYFRKYEDNNTIKDEYDEERKFINNKKKITVINRETKLKLEND